MTKLTVERLIELGVIETGHFELSCGRYSDIFIQCARLLKYPSIFEDIVSNIARSVKNSNLEIDLILAPAIGGLITAYELACSLDVPFVYTEKHLASHYLPDFFELRDRRVLIVDDVITSGRTVSQVTSLVESYGGMVAGIACIVNKESFSSNYPVFSYLSFAFKSYLPQDFSL